MRAAAWITCLWPGLPQLWFRGSSAGLAIAAAFSALLNLMLAASFIWPELLHAGLRCLGWGLITVCWCYSVWRSIRRWPEFTGGRRSDSAEDLFIQAQTEYLKGHWFEAESLWRRLACEGRDVEAQLMLAALYRRTHRTAEARRQIRRLECLDGADKWRLEVQRERQLLSERRSAGDRDRGEQDRGEQDRSNQRLDGGRDSASEAA